MIFDDPSLSLTQCGTLRRVSSGEIADSGISVGLECLDRELFDFDRAAPRLFETGAKYARIQTGWNRCEQSRGVYSFEWLDHVVDTLLAGGVQPWFNVGFGNPLYMEGIRNPAAVGCVPFYFGEETLRAWENFVTALAEHYRGRIRHWEIWNEPDVEHFWFPAGRNAADYARLLRLTAPLIRRAQPGAKIGGCCGCVRPDYDWQRDFFRSDGPKLLDFFAIHQYKIIPEVQLGRIVETWKRQFALHGNPRIEIWMGESGYPSWAPEDHWIGVYRHNAPENQAKWLLRRYLCDMESGISLTSFFQMVDLTAKPYQMAEKLQEPSRVARHGLVDGFEYEPKPSHAALSHFAAVFDCDTVKCPLFCFPETEPILPKQAQVSKLLEPALRIQTFVRNGWALYVYYLPEDVQLDVHYFGLNLAVIADEAPKALEQPVLIDLLSGVVYEVVKGASPHLFTGLPLTDYPLILTDRRALGDRIVCSFHA